MKVLVTGATGFVGGHLVRALLARGDEVRVTSRDGARAEAAFDGKAKGFTWLPVLGPCPVDALQGVDAVVHLLGENVAGGLWTAARKHAIRDSRLGGTHQLVEGMRFVAEDERPKVLVSASAVGYYGDRGDAELAESEPPGDDFLAEVCVGWEAEAKRAESLGVRVVNPRIGLVLGDGGALAKMRTPFKLGVGGRLGSGKQWMSWVSVTDLVKVMLHAIDTDGVSGPINTCPAPVTNLEFTKALGAALGRPTLFPVPGFALKTLLGGLASLFLFSQRADPKKLVDSGFTFEHPDIAAALKAALA